jgi:isoamylase
VALPLSGRRFLTGIEATELRWYTPAGTEMTGADWDDPDARSIAVYFDGADDPDRAPDGTALVDDDFLLLINAWWEPLNFDIPQTRPAQTWLAEIDTYEPSGDPEVVKFVEGDTVTVGPRSLRVLRGSSDKPADDVPRERSAP